MLRIATWNVNSIRTRLPHLLDWLVREIPDIVLLQEIKCVEEAFPYREIQDLGYEIAISGQKTYNGVAILSKGKLEITAQTLPGNPSDKQARYIEAKTLGLRVASIYLPNGNGNTEKYAYKIAWLERLYVHAKILLKTEEAVILGGDYNIAPTDKDCYDPASWASDALCLLQSRAAFRRILYLGYIDAINTLHPKPKQYTWWDYRGNAWQKDLGLRIDHLLLSPQAADHLQAAIIDNKLRNYKKPSDHAPVWCHLSEF